MRQARKFPKGAPPDRLMTRACDRLSVNVHSIRDGLQYW